MGKLVMAISAGVTAFVLALTAGAVYVSRNLTTTAAAAQASTSVPVSSCIPGGSVVMWVVVGRGAASRKYRCAGSSP